MRFTADQEVVSRTHICEVNRREGVELTHRLLPQGPASKDGASASSTQTWPVFLFVIVSVGHQLDTNLKPPGKRTPQLKDCLHQICLWLWLWAIFLIAN